MSFKKWLYCFFVVFLFCSGCHKAAPAITWSPKYDSLQNLEDHHPEAKGVTRDVKAFYDALHGKQWEATYNYRTKAFKGTVPLNYYLKDLTNSGSWELLTFQILNVNLKMDGSATSITLICRFVENPMQIESYNTVTWVNEDGTWRCDEAGPTELSMFAKIAE